MRSLNNSFSQLSTVSLRPKVSRLREILLVLTSDSALLPTPSGNASSNQSLPLTQLHNLSILSEAEAQTFFMLRCDITS